MYTQEAPTVRSALLATGLFLFLAAWATSYGGGSVVIGASLALLALMALGKALNLGTGRMYYEDLLGGIGFALVALTVLVWGAGVWWSIIIGAGILFIGWRGIQTALHKRRGTT